MDKETSAERSRHGGREKRQEEGGISVVGLKGGRGFEGGKGGKPHEPNGSNGLPLGKRWSGRREGKERTKKRERNRGRGILEEMDTEVGEGNGGSKQIRRLKGKRSDKG